MDIRNGENTLGVYRISCSGDLGHWNLSVVPRCLWNFGLPTLHYHHSVVVPQGNPGVESSAQVLLLASNTKLLHTVASLRGFRWETPSWSDGAASVEAPGRWGNDVEVNQGKTGNPRCLGERKQSSPVVGAGSPSRKVGHSPKADFFRYKQTTRTHYANPLCFLKVPFGPLKPQVKQRKTGNPGCLGRKANRALLCGWIRESVTKSTTPSASPRKTLILTSFLLICCFQIQTVQIGRVQCSRFVLK